ncbi:MAG: SHOCT domain-containing protein [Oscillospiraceae bacterium]|nr:SHOCT domain-containing protein [Oscillospiraceae bacterium]
MKRKVTYRPSKASSILGGVVGVIFVLIGIFEAIPNAGLFGVFWTLMALVMTVMNLYHAFGKGYIGPEIEIEEDEARTPKGTAESPAFLRDSAQHEHITAAGITPKARLEQLETLKEAGLLTREEYEAKRAEILREL